IGLGAGARRRQARRAGGQDRSGDSAAAAAHHRDASEEDGEGDGQGRSGAHRRDGEVAQGQARRVRRAVPVMALSATRAEAAVERLDVHACTIPTDAPESDGTLEWDSTTIVIVQAHAGGHTGLGYTYTHDAAARLIEDKLAPAARGVVVETDLSSAWHEMGRLLRNVGRPGLGFMALSAVDIALWDLKARVLGQPLVDVLGGVRDEAAVYGSGGFTSYSLERLAEQLAGWVAQGIPRVKMKLGRTPDEDPERLDTPR